jgi:hypothetical protein
MQAQVRHVPCLRIDHVGAPRLRLAPEPFRPARMPRQPCRRQFVLARAVDMREGVIGENSRIRQAHTKFLGLQRRACFRRCVGRRRK